LKINTKLNNLLKIKQILSYLIGYFFIKGIKSHDQAVLVWCAFVKLYEAGVSRGMEHIMDCHRTNQAMVSDLGGSLKIDELETKLYHPSNPNLYIYLYFDNCHFIKLMRHTSCVAIFRTKHIKRKLSWHLRMATTGMTYMCL